MISGKTRELPEISNHHGVVKLVLQAPLTLRAERKTTLAHVGGKLAHRGKREHSVTVCYF